MPPICRRSPRPARWDHRHNVFCWKTGESIETAVIGREDAIGTKVGVRPQLALAKAVVQPPGSALRIEFDEFQEAARQSLAITHLATCANDVMIANLQQAVACNAIHLVEKRQARWLLHASYCQQRSPDLPHGVAIFRAEARPRGKMLREAGIKLG